MTTLTNNQLLVGSYKMRTAALKVAEQYKAERNYAAAALLLQLAGLPDDSLGLLFAAFEEA